MKALGILMCGAAGGLAGTFGGPIAVVAVIIAMAGIAIVKDEKYQ